MALRTHGLRRKVALVASIAGSLLCLSAIGTIMTTPAAQAQVRPATKAGRPAFRALVFSRTTAFRHDSIPDGVAAIQKLGREHRFAVDATEDDTLFTDANLARYDVVVFVSTTGDPVGTDAEKAAFQRYIERGGGFVGIHAAADSGYTWPWYGKLVGAYFKSHPAIQPATVKIEDPAHPSMRSLPRRWTRTDEWYNYQSNPRGMVHVLARLDESSYDVGTDGMGPDHPITWCHDYDGGRAWYTGLGHTKESYTEPAFLRMLLGGLRTAAGVVRADCAVSPLARH